MLNLRLANGHMDIRAWKRHIWIAMVFRRITNCTICFLFWGGIVPYRGHMLCPCGSGKRLRNCHGPALLRDLTSDYSFFYKLNAAEIIHCAHEEMVEQREAKRRLQAAIRSGRTI